jgi:DNA-binding response OmpR family regulator
MTQVLIIAKDGTVREQLRQVARQSGVNAETAEDFGPGFAQIEREPPVLVVAENPPDDETMETLSRTLREHAPVTPLLVFLPERNSSLALKRMAGGAYDCLCPPLTPGDFLAAGKRAVSRTGRRLFTSKPIRPLSWWRQPLFFMAAGLAAFLALTAVAIVGLWEPPFKIYKLAADHPAAAAGARDHIWVADWSSQNLTEHRVDRDYLSILRVQKLSDFMPVAMTLAPFYVYTASSDGRIRRHRQDDTFTVVASVEGPGPAVSGLAWDGESLWSCDSFTGKIYEYDARMAVKNVHPSPAEKPLGLAWEDGWLWVGDGETQSLWRMKREGVDWKKEGPFALEVFTHNKSLQFSGFTVWKGRAWIVSETGGVLIRHRLPKT